MSRVVAAIGVDHPLVCATEAWLDRRRPDRIDAAATMGLGSSAANSSLRSRSRAAGVVSGFARAANPTRTIAANHRARAIILRFAFAQSRAAVSAAPALERVREAGLALQLVVNKVDHIRCGRWYFFNHGCPRF
jgi:hypothetical protein